MSNDTPVLLLLFNRPHHTQRLFDVLSQVRPSRLFIACDGPRPSMPSDLELVRQVRHIASSVSWDCDIHQRFLPTNLGMMDSVYSSISWFFDHVEAGIILEDDCVPSPSFFDFCHIMLERYQHDPSVFSVSGRNHLGQYKPHSQYIFTTGSIWGWATWRRAWIQFDLTSVLSKTRKQLSHDLLWLKQYAPNKYSEIINGVLRSADGSSPTWDYPWAYVRIANKSLNVVSSFNLVRNIGTGPSATNTSSLADTVPVYNRQYSSAMPSIPLILDHHFLSELDKRRKPDSRLKLFFSRLLHFLSR